MKIVIIAGTRPELIKLAPVDRAFRKAGADTRLWLTGQHSSLAEGPVKFFGLRARQSWQTLSAGQGSNELLAKLLGVLDVALSKERPDAVVVQGDTTTALAGALAAFHRGIHVAHVEAGLRSGDLAAPFPEEMNRRAIDSFARWLFPPTESARRALAREGHKNFSKPTGNTGIDALFWARQKVRGSGHWPASVPAIPAGIKLVLSTGHRRENLGDPMFGALRAMGEEIASRGDCALIHVLHPNPAATDAARKALGGLKNVHLIPAVDYPDFVALLDRASVAVSDSGGIQEEAPSFGLKILITRTVTERPEVLKHGGVLVGTDSAKLRRELKKALAAAKLGKDGLPAHKPRKTPFGDGKASERIAKLVLADAHGPSGA